MLRSRLLRTAQLGKVVELKVSRRRWLLERLQRIEIQERVVWNNAAGGYRATSIPLVLQRILNQSRADLKVAQGIHAAMLDAVRLALIQVGASILRSDAITTGISQVERTILIADPCVLSGKDALAIRYYPVKLLRATDLSAGLTEA